jgi:hypothetical protein
MSALTICNCVLKIKDQLGAAFATAELVFDPRKSQVNGSDAVYLSRVERATAVPGIVVQDLIYLSKSVSPLTPITVAYTAGATAGAEVVTVVGTAISVQIESGVSTAAQVKAAVLASAPASLLVTVLLSGTSGAFEVTAAAATLSDEYCYLALSETTTNSRQVVFELNYDDAGKTSGSIIFDPIMIPNQAFQDLSSILTVSRG